MLYITLLLAPKISNLSMCSLNGVLWPLTSFSFMASSDCPVTGPLDFSVTLFSTGQGKHPLWNLFNRTLDCPVHTFTRLFGDFHFWTPKDIFSGLRLQPHRTVRWQPHRTVRCLLCSNSREHLSLNSEILAHRTVRWLLLRLNFSFGVRLCFLCYLQCFLRI